MTEDSETTLLAIRGNAKDVKALQDIFKDYKGKEIISALRILLTQKRTVIEETAPGILKINVRSPSDIVRDNFKEDIKAWLPEYLEKAQKTMFELWVAYEGHDGRLPSGVLREALGHYNTHRVKTGNANDLVNPTYKEEFGQILYEILMEETSHKTYASIRQHQGLPPLAPVHAMSVPQSKQQVPAGQMTLFDEKPKAEEPCYFG